MVSRLVVARTLGAIGLVVLVFAGLAGCGSSQPGKEMSGQDLAAKRAQMTKSDSSHGPTQTRR